MTAPIAEIPPASNAATTVDAALLSRVTDYVREYMSRYDGSHDFAHVERVLRLALHIQARTPGTSRPLVALCALLHDVGDAKYIQPGEDKSRLVADVLRSLGADAALANKVQLICLGVSYSVEVRDPVAAAARLTAHPELAVVQDADRLDAIGAVGIARTFAFGGARGSRLEDTMQHFDDKLLRLEGMMKTPVGRTLARERTERLKLMQSWWRDEADGLGLDDATV